MFWLKELNNFINPNRRILTQDKVLEKELRVYIKHEN